MNEVYLDSARNSYVARSEWKRGFWIGTLTGFLFGCIVTIVIANLIR